MLLLKKRFVWATALGLFLAIVGVGLYSFFGNETVVEEEKEVAVTEPDESAPEGVVPEVEVTEITETRVPVVSLGVVAGVEIATQEVNEDEHAHVLEHWRGKIDPPLRDWRSLDLALGTGEVKEFALPNGTTLPMTFKRFESYGGAKGVYVGSVVGKPFAEVTLSYVRDSVVGAIRMPGDGVSWEIRNAGNGEQFFELVDLSTLGRCGVCQIKE